MITVSRRRGRPGANRPGAAHLRGVIAALVVVLAASLFSQPAQSGDLLIMHRWYTPAELAALNILREKVESRGDRWIPLAINARGKPAKTVIDLIADGIYPNAFHEMHPGIYRPLAETGKLLSLQDQFADSGLLAQLPDLVRDAITVDADVVKIPAALHADATIYYNKDVARAAGVDPQSWTSLEAMWADFPAVRDAGYLPLAIGEQPWQVTYLAMSLLASLGGAEVYDGIFGATPDPQGLDDPAFAEMLVWLRRFEREADDSAPGRDWNIATGMVISGQALMQVQGDGMRAEWQAAGKTEADDYGCLFLPGAKAVPMSVETWGLVGGLSAESEATGRAFAQDVTAVDTQIRFARAIGAVPVRRDAWIDLDPCARQVATAIDTTGHAVLTPLLTTPAPWIAAIQRALTDYWDTPEMSPRHVIAALHAAAARPPLLPAAH